MMSLEGGVDRWYRIFDRWSSAACASKWALLLKSHSCFQGTLMENLRYGRLDASDEEVYSSSPYF
jgi:ABC-type multidrug transport system fused ATPase/permease subunit